MKCPFCNEDMEKGFIQSGNFILWTDNPHKISLLPRGEKEFLVVKNYLGGGTIGGYCCRTCKRFILEY